ncbi:MAG: hypothetical protein WKF87_01115 [Chryseolinea sp.]
MKVNSSIYKGIQFVQVNALPADQKDKLLSTINRELLIKILIDGKLVGNCLQFKDYESWFDNFYQSDQTINRNSKVLQNTTENQLVSFAMKSTS